MGWLAAIKAAFSALGQIFGFFERRQLLNAGKAEAHVEAQKSHNKRVEEADIARTDESSIDELRGRRFRD